MLTIKTTKRRQSRRSGVFIVNFEHVFTPFSSLFNANSEQTNFSLALECTDAQLPRKLLEQSNCKS